MDDLKIVSGAEMRKAREDVEQGVPLILPSGWTVMVKAISLDACVRLGYIPDGLTQIVIDAFNGKQTQAKAVETLGELKQEIEYWETLCRACLVSPRIVDDPTADDEISIEDLGAADKQHIAEAVLRPATMLRPFCDEQNALMERLLRQPEVRDESERDAESAPVGE